MREDLLSEFRARFGAGGPAYAASAPGRVNLIGEHTDYNGGYVLPMALNRRTTIIFRPRRDATVCLYSREFGEAVTFAADRPVREEHPFWANYPRGVAAILAQEGFLLRGLDGVIASDVPIGGGLSSSAALELAAAMAFCTAGGFEVEKMRLVCLCQRAENEFVGMRCGIMDQFIAVFGQDGHAVFLDCQTMAHEAVPLDHNRARVVVCNTGVKHELAASAYNERRATCEAALARIRRHWPHVHSFRDLTQQQLAQAQDWLDETMRRRARHVVSENERVLRAVAALKMGDLREFGRLMNASHESLRNDYEVSCDELDLMVELAREAPGTLGARLTGAGFGGCTVNLVLAEAVLAFCALVSERYRQRTGIVPAVHVVEAGGGAEVVRLE